MCALQMSSEQIVSRIHAHAGVKTPTRDRYRRNNYEPDIAYAKVQSTIAPLLPPKLQCSTEWLFDVFDVFHSAAKSFSIVRKKPASAIAWTSRYLIVKGMMRSLANVHCELFVPPPNGVVLFNEAS